MPSQPPAVRTSSWKGVLAPLLVAAVMIASVALLWLLYQKTQSGNSQEEHAFESNLRLLRQIDAEWNVAVLRAKVGLSTNYDAMVDLLHSSRAAQAELAQSSVSDSPGIPGALRAMEGVFADKAELVEQFKSRNAIVRNSLRYLPTAADEVLAVLAPGPGPGPGPGAGQREERELGRRIIEVETQALKYASMDDPAQRSTLVSAVDRMVATVPTRPLDNSAMDSLGNFVRHATTFLAQRSLEDDLVLAIAETATVPGIDHVWTAYEAATQRRARSTERWRTALFAYSAAMLLLLGVIGSRLRKSYKVINQVNRELVHVNEDLEARVAERTASLEESQAQLRIALGQKEAMLAQERELGELKTRFVSMASHEFRTPLTTIQTSTDLLVHYADRLSSEDKAESLGDIQGAVNRMRSVMENILMLGKLDSHTNKFQPVATDVHHLFRQMAAETASADGHKHVVELAPPLIPWDRQPLLDEALMRQIVGNLLTNACKYSPEGSTVTLRWQRVAWVSEAAAELATDKGSGTVLSIEVIDQGIGIPAADLPRLFETFHRASNTGTIQGTGLGLAIVKRAVDTLNGDIDVASEVGVGTRFSLRLPWKD